MVVESWLARAIRSAPQSIAVEDGEQSLSYAQLFTHACTGAGELRARGVQQGDAVAIALASGLPFALALHSCWLAGASVVPIDVRLAAEEREKLTAGCALTIEEPLLLLTTHAMQSTVTREVAGKDTATRELAGKHLCVTHDLDAVAAVIHTSGTTSLPKRVELTFGNLLWSAQGSAVALGVHPQERWLCTLPVCHVGGLSILVRSAIYATTAVLHERFQAEHALMALMEQDITLVSVVATTLARLLDAGLERPPKLRCALAGGGPVPVALLERAAAAGVQVCQTYGLTEACSQVSTVPLDAADPDDLGAGRPLFCTRVRITEDGEILVAGPTVAPRTLSPDGWLHTGDLGSLDAQGNLHVTGRKADTIISGGENVAPAEVEAALEAHPQVAEAAVVGRPHPDWGEEVTAIVVPSGGAQPQIEDLRAHCIRRLAPYKVPKSFVLTKGPLPRTASGKLLRRQLDEQITGMSIAGRSDVGRCNERIRRSVM